MWISGKCSESKKNLKKNLWKIQKNTQENPEIYSPNYRIPDAKSLFSDFSMCDKMHENFIGKANKYDDFNNVTLAYDDDSQVRFTS